MFAKLLPSTRASAFDALLVGVLFLAGAVYHWDFNHWSIGLVGNQVYGDAHFWWDGAVRVSEGLFRDHPGKGFRPGFFAIAGAALPVLGTDPHTFHKALLVNFLAVSAFLYLGLRRPLGRAAAAAAVCLLVFSPYTAEWIATPTTDGLGLVLHLASLACLLLAVQSNFHRGWFAGFGVLFSLATLTRPVVTPFIGLVVLALLFLPARSWRVRLLAVGVTVVAFALPTFVWMGVQRALVQQWSVSTNGDAALYAASDPNVQTWRPSTYEKIHARLCARLGVEDLTEAQINQEFRRLTLLNYRRHWAYHLQRAVPHLWSIASFSPGSASHGSTFFQMVILSALAAGLALSALVRGFGLHALVLAMAAAAVWVSAPLSGFLTLGGCVLALLIRPGRTGDLPMFLVACYWLSGVLGLFLTGGTWSVPLGTPVAINGLGHRVGSQVFFAGDLLACFLLLRLASFQVPPGAPVVGWVRARSSWLASLTTAPVRPAILATSILLAVVVVLDAVVLAAGTAVVAGRAWSQEYGPHVPYPDLAPVAELCRSRLHSVELAQPRSDDALLTALSPREEGRTEGRDVLVTGALGICLWDMTGQERTQVYFNRQDEMRPFHLSASTPHIEFPSKLEPSVWVRRQGAFVLRGGLDRPPATNQPYYLSAPAVRGFVPLLPDGSGYDLEQAVWFPLVRYASQLEAAGGLTCTTGKLTWSVESGSVPYQRRLSLKPAKSEGTGVVGLRLALDRAVGRRTLRFAYQQDGESPGAPVELQVWLTKASSPDRERVLVQPVETEHDLAAVEIDCSGTDVTAVELSFGNVPAEGVWVHELNLAADDFRE